MLCGNSLCKLSIFSLRYDFNYGKPASSSLGTLAPLLRGGGGTLNFTAAGPELGLTQAAICQHIKLLEVDLGASLFRRLPRGVELTPEGAAYLPHVQAAFHSLTCGTEDLFGAHAETTYGFSVRCRS